jgi:hypothetical protein
MINQGWGYRTGPDGGWSVLRNENWKYIKHISGEQELYDMINDPYELESKHASPDHQTLISNMRSRLESLEGVQITTVWMNAGRLGVPYSFQMQAWGGQKPYQWSVVEQDSTDTLPNGLNLDPETGLISGVPTEDGIYNLKIMVQGSSTATHLGRLQRFIMPLTLVINP